MRILNGATRDELGRWSLSGSYVIYACFAFLSVAFILSFVKETKGKALEEMG